LHRLVLRPFLVVLTLGMLVVALFQSVGRLGFMMLDDLELAANQWLSGQQIRVTGLEGSWRFLDPVVMVDRIDMPAGYLTDVVVELDWVESLVRNRFVTRRLLVGGGQVVVERTKEGKWRLVGSAADGNFDPSGLLYQSDELRLNGVVALRREGDAAAPVISVHYAATNRGGIHRHRLSLANSDADCSDVCEMQLEFQAQDGLWPFWEKNRQLRVAARDFHLPQPLVGMSALDVTALGLRWHQRGDASGGSVKLQVGGLRLPSDVALSGELTARVQGHLDIHQAIIDRLELRQGSPDEPAGGPVAAADVLRLPVIRVRKDEEIAQAWTDSVDLGEAAQFLRRALRGMDKPQRWLKALNVHAEGKNLRGYLRIPTGEMGYAGTLSGISLDGFQGVPYMRGGAGEVLGFSHGLQLHLKSQDMLLQFPDTFTDKWQLPYVQGVVQAWFGGGYLGLRGLNLRAETMFSRASGGFALARPQERTEQRLTLLINMDAIEIDQARAFVPYKLSPGLAQWLETAPRAGLLTDVRLGLHGESHPERGEFARRVELSSHISDGRVQYSPDWPEVTDLSADVAVMGQTVRVVVDRGTSAAAQLAGSRVVLRNNAAYADVALDVQLDNQAALDFVRDTPLRSSMPFVQPNWSGAGALRLQGDVHVPLGAAASERLDDELGVELTATLQGVDLDMPDYRVAVKDLNGRVRYRYPHWIRAAGITGKMFDHDLLLSADNDAHAMILHLQGHAADSDVLRVVDMKDPGVFAGSTHFAADVYVATDPDHVSRLDIKSDLRGMELSLPAEFSKSAELPRPIELSMQFLDGYEVLSFRHGTAQGWLHIDEVPVRGAIGFGSPPHVVDSHADYLLLTGRLEGFALADVIPDDGNDSADEMLPLRLLDLQVGHIDLDDFRIDDAVLNGDVNATGFAINVASRTVAGNLRSDADQPLAVNLDYVVFPSSDGDEPHDPLQPKIIPELPRAMVQVGSLRVGDRDYGRWSFELEPRPDGVLLANLDAQMRGVRILAPEGVMWMAERNESRFQGKLQAGNLAEVLPLWGYAPSLETESASLTGDLRWAGSPANVDLDALVGEAAVRADQGRFLDVDSGGGAMRIFSLMNFNTIFKRIRGDFSDVTGKGVSFDKLQAKVAFDRGLLEFVEPMKVKGTGSSFEVAGKVNLEDGGLDNEMIVTLPVSKSLPWYAAYIAIANPLAGAGILVGERVLRKPLEQFSSAKYEISGTLDEPRVTLVSVFDTSMKPGEGEAVAADVPPAEGAPVDGGGKE